MDVAIKEMKAAAEKAYFTKGSRIVKMNTDAIDAGQEKTKLKKGDNLFHLRVRECDAQAIFNETDHSMRILKGSLLPQSTVPSYRDGAKRNAVIAAMSKPTKDGFWELQRDYVLNSPSTAASYCSGRSCNGWIHWINDAGQSLDDLYRSE